MRSKQSAEPIIVRKDSGKEMPTTNGVRTLRGVTAVGCIVALTGFVSLAAGASTTTVQILGINDFHGAISQTGKVDKRPAGGASFLAQYLRDRQATNPNTILVHAGDMVGASQPVSSLLEDEPTGEFLNFMGFQVGTPGNHDFDAGQARLFKNLLGGPSADGSRYYAGSSFPFISANIVSEATGNPILPPYVIKVVDGIPIGFIGVTTDTTPTIVMASGVKGIKFAPSAPAINKWVGVLKEKGVRSIVVLAHEDGRVDKATGAVTGPLADLANAIDDEVDLIVAGHAHVAINNVVDGKLIVEALSGGTAFDAVNLVIDRDSGDVVSKSAEVITTFGDVIKPEPRMAQLVASYEAKVKPLVSREVSSLASDITRTQNEAGESALGSLIADGQRAAAKTQMAFMNPGGIRRDLPAGQLAWGTMFECQPFANDMMKFAVTGDQVYRILNQQWQTPSNRFLQISGLRYTWDDKRAVGDKVTAVSLEDGTPIDRKTSYTATANAFLATGGDNFVAFKESGSLQYVGNDLDIFTAYIKSLPAPIAAGIVGRATVIK